MSVKLGIEYGVARISTGKQNIERQVRNILAKYPNAKIIKETFTGVKIEGRRDFSILFWRFFVSVISLILLYSFYN